MARLRIARHTKRYHLDSIADHSILLDPVTACGYTWSSATCNVVKPRFDASLIDIYELLEWLLA